LHAAWQRSPEFGPAEGQALHGCNTPNRDQFFDPVPIAAIRANTFNRH
jgi:hypothetical protein